MNLGIFTKLERKENEFKNLETEIQEIVDKLNVVGLSISVIENNKISYSQGFGYADIDKNIKTDTNTIYRIASISKSITASAIMKLYEEGKFKLDDDINDYLNGFEVRNPNFPDEKITFRMLLTHTSSIIDGDTYSTIYDIQDFGDYKPGDQFEYSNYGYNLLATLIEQISNQDFEDFVQENIFKPLNMKASFNPNKFEDVDNIAVLYGIDEDGNYYERLNDKKRIEDNIVISSTVRDKDGKIPLGNAFKYSPTGGLRTSPNELAKFMIMLSNKGLYNGTRVLKKDTVELMEQIHWYGDALNGLYKCKGLGLHITDDLIEGSRLIGHTGEAYGLLSNMFYDENRKFGYIMMLNGNNYKFGDYGFTKVEKEIAKIIEKNFSQDKADSFE
ncbi:MAG: serine hydrolase domain-containing protein [Romboutsia timonensis]|uniref:serine hydrolase domain-containing protein n=1 Tax=Romboutsia timonensis TaxID=1776391 RepID=UPI002A75ACC4|nr:serine hydrolase domain-containing protein [Romboutsia timonensis]MDY2883663.1 serine hydrolase domain-containing protein [Romboutsia timonensis]